MVNFKKAKDKVDLVYRSWSWRKPSPIAASIIVRSLMASTTTHLLQNFDMDQETKEGMSKTFTRLLLASSGRPQIHKQRLTQPFARGGANLLDIELFTNSLRLTWL